MFVELGSTLLVVGFVLLMNSLLVVVVVANKRILFVGEALAVIGFVVVVVDTKKMSFVEVMYMWQMMVIVEKTFSL